MQATLSSIASGKQFLSASGTGVVSGPAAGAVLVHAGGPSAASFNSPSVSNNWRASATGLDGLARGREASPAHDPSGMKLQVSVRSAGRLAAAGAAVGVAEGPGLAHDAGNLLGALRLYCDLLALPGVLREEHRHYAEELRHLSGRSGALIDRLLNPRVTAGAAAGPAEPVVLPEVIDRCRGVLAMVARRAVEVACEPESRTPVAVSREALERILVNLTKNAAEASPGDSTITLRVSARRGRASGRRGNEPARVVLSVEDRGRGMSAAAVKVLLERSAQPLDRGRFDGSSLESGAAGQAGRQRGIGLRVVRELVDASGGEFRLKSRSGCGTTVEVAWAVDAPARSDAAEGQMLDGDGCGGDRVASRFGTGNFDQTGNRGRMAAKGSVAC